MNRIRRSVWQRIPIWRDKFLNLRRLEGLSRQVARLENGQPKQRPVIFFNASTRLDYLSQNGAFSLLTSWGLRLAGIPVAHFVCQRGMSRCMLGSTERNYYEIMPCERCMRLSKVAFAGADVHGFTLQKEAGLEAALEGLDVAQLAAFSYQGMDYGQIALPSVRWCKRRHNLEDDPKTRLLFTEFILSAHYIRQAFNAMLEQVKPSAVVLFNGLMFPEAVAKLVAREHNIPVVMHEVGYQAYSAFFTTEEATAREIFIDDGFQLNQAQEARLQAYLEQRFSGSFTMAGIQFWPEMSQLGAGFLEKADRYKQIVPVFTNVIFDTSQPHANVAYAHMFVWLDDVLEIIKSHPDTLFVIRAHPDELRTGKASHETVGNWVRQHGVDRLENVVFIDADEFISSYELIGRAKFLIVYNSSIGLEGALLGKTVLCGGKAWYARYQTVFMPETPQGFRAKANQLLSAEAVETPAAFQHNARRLLYYQNFLAALPFADFLEKHSLRGFVRMRRFDIQQLLPDRSSAVEAVMRGLHDGDKVFTIKDEL